MVIAIAFMLWYSVSLSLVVFAALLFLLIRYRLDKEYDGIMAVLEERHRQENLTT